MASIVTDGDWRSVELGYGDRNEGACPKCELEYVGAGKFLELGPGKGNYKTPPSFFLLRGDPDSKAYPTKPGFLTVLTKGNPPSELPPADGRPYDEGVNTSEATHSRKSTSMRSQDRLARPGLCLGSPLVPGPRLNESTWAVRLRARRPGTADHVLPAKG